MRNEFNKSDEEFIKALYGSIPESISFSDERLESIKNSRKLEREAQTNMEAMWLLAGLRPKYITEHMFGTLKRQRGFTFTLMRGKEKVLGEVGLMFIGYNLSRCISVIGVENSLKSRSFFAPCFLSGCQYPVLCRAQTAIPAFFWSYDYKYRSI